MITTKRTIMPNVLSHNTGANVISKQGIDLITHFEGLYLEAYPDPGSGGKPYTIGYGTTQYPDGRSVKLGDKITEHQAKDYLAHDLRKFSQMVLKKITRPLYQNELDALTSFAYNAGTSYKSGSQWKDYNIWAKVNSKTITPEYWEALAITASGKRLNGLVRRRKSEAHLYFTGGLLF